MVVNITGLPEGCCNTTKEIRRRQLNFPRLQRGTCLPAGRFEKQLLKMFYVCTKHTHVFIIKQKRFWRPFQQRQ